MASTAAARSEALIQSAKINFIPGKKEVYLPNHVITFLRPGKKASPYEAHFKVPLTFNKLDLRDYLYHAYNVRTTAIRSHIVQPTAEHRYNGRGKWFKPRAIKHMIAVLEEPFVWPEPPSEEDREAFDHENWKRIQKAKADSRTSNKAAQSGQILTWAERDKPAELDMLREQAQELLDGKAKWKTDATLDDVWESIIRREEAKK